MRLGTGLSAMLLMVVVLACGSRPASSAGAAPVPQARPEGYIVHSALVQVDCPAGFDDAQWKRQIASYAQRAHGNNVIQGVLEDLKGRKEKIRPDALENTRLGMGVFAVVVEGTSLIQIYVRCSDDEAVNAEITNIAAGVFVRGIRDEQLERKERAVKFATDKANQARDRYEREKTAYERLAGQSNRSLAEVSEREKALEAIRVAAVEADRERQEVEGAMLPELVRVVQRAM